MAMIRNQMKYPSVQNQCLNQMKGRVRDTSAALECPFLCCTLPLVPPFSSKKALPLLSAREKRGIGH